MQVIGATTREARASQRGLPPLTGVQRRILLPPSRNVAAVAGVIWSRKVTGQDRVCPDNEPGREGL